METGGIKFDLRGLASELKERLIAVPIYQRSYAWTAEEIAEYWGDLRSAFAERAPEYFLGTIVLTRQSVPGRDSVIDGQQRLATTSILLAAIRDEYEARGDKKRAGVIQRTYLSTVDLGTAEEVARLTLNSEDAFFYEQRIVQGALSPDPTKSSHRKIARAYEILRENIAKVADDAGSEWMIRLNQWVEYLRVNVKSVVLEVPTEADAFLIFETLNDRGADLTIADLLKNYLFGKAGEKLDSVATKIRSGEIKTASEILAEIAAIVPTDDEFRSAFATARVPKSNLARYYLLAIEQHCAGEKEPELVPNANEEQVNLEHVLPKRASPKDWGAQFDEEERKTYLHRLGNLTLLQKGPRMGDSEASLST